MHKVPSSDYEALRSPLMGLFEKRRARYFFMCVCWYTLSSSFLGGALARMGGGRGARQGTLGRSLEFGISLLTRTTTQKHNKKQKRKKTQKNKQTRSYVQNYNHADPSTHQGLDLSRLPMAALYNHFGLDPQTIDFVGHALALHRDDEYLVHPALETVLRIRLYHDSLARYEGLTSPYIYPRYGLGELPQAFARLSAVYGGTYMLGKSDATVVFDPATGKAVGVASAGETARARLIVGDPSYFPGHTRAVSRVVRALCVLSHPIPGTDDSHSAQIILPQKQIGRPSDTYVFCCSYAHAVAPRGKWLAFVSSAVDPRLPPGAPVDPEAELAAGLALLGPVDERFFTVSEVREPVPAGATAGGGGAAGEGGAAVPPPDNVHISRGYDATTHFETTVDDVLDMYARITGRQLDLDGPKPVRTAGGGGGARGSTPAAPAAPAAASS